MRFSGLLTRNPRPLPGVAGVARMDRRTDSLARRVRPGDIVVLDQVDLDRHTAETIVRSRAGAVVNAAESISGRLPNIGPEILIAADIPLVDNVGADMARHLRNGSRIRVHEGVIYQGDREIGRGSVQTSDTIAARLFEANAGMSVQLEAFSANTIEFLRRERAMIVDGVGVPTVDVPMADRHVLVVSGGSECDRRLRDLRRYLKEQQPVLIGVEAGAQTLVRMGHRPDVIVGDPVHVSITTLKSAATVVLPAADGQAEGLERMRDLGVSAVPFVSSGNPEDLALLVAEAGGAALVITLGGEATLREFLDRSRSSSNPSTFLTRLRLGARVVDAQAVVSLHRYRVSLSAVVALVLVAVLVVVATLVISGVAPVYAEMLDDAWRAMSSWGREILK